LSYAELLAAYLLSNFLGIFIYFCLNVLSLFTANFDSTRINIVQFLYAGVYLFVLSRWQIVKNSVVQQM